jgi:hypothetical protein
MSLDTTITIQPGQGGPPNTDGTGGPGGDRTQPNGDRQRAAPEWQGPSAGAYSSFRPAATPGSELLQQFLDRVP